MAGLRLEVRDFADLTRWRWALIDEATGAFLADHEVRLDSDDWQFRAFGGLTGYLSWHVAPDQRREEEARIAGEVGAWIGSQVLGPITDALSRKHPVAMRVVVPGGRKCVAIVALLPTQKRGEGYGAQILINVATWPFNRKH